MMKLLGILIMLFISTVYGTAQEIPVLNSPDDFIIQRTEITPSLSILAPENPYVGKFRIRTVNFDVKDEPIQINISEIMREEEQMRYNSYVELAHLFSSLKKSLQLVSRQIQEKLMPDILTKISILLSQELEPEIRFIKMLQKLQGQFITVDILPFIEGIKNP